MLGKASAPSSGFREVSPVPSKCPGSPRSLGGRGLDFSLPSLGWEGNQ